MQIYNFIKLTCKKQVTRIWHSILFCFRQDLTMDPRLGWNSRCRPMWLGEHRNPPASASQLSDLMACTNITNIIHGVLKKYG